MLRRLFSLVYGVTPVQFESRYAVEESVSRLGASIKPVPIFNPIPGYGAQGTVSRDLVSIRRQKLFSRNGFKPVFYGRFEHRGGTTILSGGFGFSLRARISVTFILAFILLWEALAIVGAFKKPDKWEFPLFGLVMLVIAGLIILIARNHWDDDVAWIKAYIADAIVQHPARHED